MGLLDATAQRYRDELEQAHAAFLAEPTEERAWLMAAAVECLLQVLDIG